MIILGTNGGTYTYNGLDYRTKKVQGGTTYAYTLEDDSIDASVLGDGQASCVQAGGLVSETRVGTSKFYHADALGGTRNLTDSTQARSDTFTFDAFGNVVNRVGTKPIPFQHS